MTMKACYNMTRCDNGGWCGERRKNTTTGAVQRCADRTRCSSRSLSLWTSWSNIMFLIVRYGKSCASTCGKGDNDYHWCWVGWHLEDVILIICQHMEWIFDLIFIDGALWFQDWEYCAPVGQTRYGAACVGDCAQRGKNYWWSLYFFNVAKITY